MTVPDIEHDDTIPTPETTEDHDPGGCGFPVDRSAEDWPDAVADPGTDDPAGDP